MVSDLLVIYCFEYMYRNNFLGKSFDRVLSNVLLF